MSEEFFKILEEITPPTNSDFHEINLGRNPFVGDDKKVMWGLNNADPQMETYMSQFTNHFNKTPIEPPKVYPRIKQFQNNPYQEENNIINEVWDSVICNPTPNKPVNIPKIGPIQEIGSRKRCLENQSSVVRESRKTPTIAAPQFPELKKFLEDKSKPTPYQYNGIIIEGPKRLRMEYRSHPTNIILLQK
jgi:hypothetical protein